MFLSHQPSLPSFTHTHARFARRYFDNQPVLDLIEKKRPPGILALLDEESVMPRATDDTFAQKCQRNIENRHYTPMGNSHFQIKHYAGDVTYANFGMIEKNKDQLNKNLVEMLQEQVSPRVHGGRRHRVLSASPLR